MTFKNHRRIAMVFVCSALIFFIGAANAANKKPIYRYYNPATDDYYLTDVQASMPGYMYQGIAFEVYDQAEGKYSPLYRCKVAAGFGPYSGKHHIRPPGSSASICGYPWNAGSQLLGYVHPSGTGGIKLYGAEVHPNGVPRGFWYINLSTTSQPEAQQYIDALGSVQYKAVLQLGGAAP